MATFTEEGVCSYVELPPSDYTRLSNRISSLSSNLNQKITDITPYSETKRAYIDDTYVEFNKAKSGIITAQCIDDYGIQIPTELIVDGEVIKVCFEPLSSVCEVTISIQ